MTERRARQHHQRVPQCGAETMEERQLPAATALFIPITGELSIELDSTDSVRITSVNGLLSVQASTNGGPYQPVNTIGTVSASSVVSIDVLGGDDANTIDFSGITAAAFTSLTSLVADAANGNDLLIGSPDLADVLIGGNGEDTIQGQGGNDTISGGDGNDQISTGTGDDSISAGDGNDNVNGEDGNDTINAGNGQDTVSGGTGNDSISGQNGQDSLLGDAGNDTINGDGGTDTIDGGDDNDLIFGGEFNDSLDGNAGNDTLYGQGGNDTLDGNRGNDQVVGGAGDDAVLGGAGQDTVNGNGGNDRVFGDSGDDVLIGGSGNDTMMGMAGNDTISGQGGLDQIFGGGDFDLSFDADVMNGGDGVDILNSIGPPLLDMSVSDVTITEGTSGSTAATFTFTLSQPLEFTVSVEYATRDGSAFAGSDYTAASGVVSFAAGQTVQTLSIDVTPDANFDAAASENFFIDLINPERARLMRFNAEATIIDDDLPPPPPLVDLVILLDDSTAMEAAGPTLAGAFGPLMQTLQTQFQNSIAVGVARYEVYSTGNDRPYILNQPLLSVANPNFTAAMTAALARTTPGNGGATASTGIEALFQLATGVGFDGNANGSVFNSGLAGPLTTQLTPGTSGDVPSFRPFVPDATGPVVTATNPIAPDGIGFRPGSLRLVMMLTDNGFVFVDEAASTYTGVNNMVVPDTSIEAGGTATTQAGAATFSATLAALLQDNIRVIGLGGNQTDTMVDPNDPAAAPRLPLTSLATLTGATNVNGLVLPSGVVPRQPPGAPPDDIQPGESLYFGIDASDAPSIVNAITNGVFGSLNPVNISANVAAGIEQDAGTRTLTFTISLDTFSPQDVTVDYTFVDGTATAGLDYLSASGTVTFLGSVSGTPQLQQTITVDILGDELFEPNEFFSLVLSNPSVNARIAIDPVTGALLDTTTATILDDDPAPDAGDVFIGGEGADLITGSIGNDTINGQGGNDSILGGAGNDSLLGGSGSDTLEGEAGDDTLDGQGGNDVLIGGDGDDVFQMTNNAGGNDFAEGGEGFNQIVLFGTGNADTLTVGQNSGRISVTNGVATLTANTNMSIQGVVVNGLGGDDTITVQDLSSLACAVLVTINGGEGNDLITGQGANLGVVRLGLNGDAGNDTIIGTNGADTINGGSGNDAVNGQGGNDQIVGGLGDDTLAGGLGNDTLDAGNGNDFVTGNEGDDSLNGGDGNDTLRGMDGNDTLLGVAGDDLLNGMAGDDSILGGVGQDAVSGGAGHDTIDGGRNNDTLNGNDGNDRIRGDHGDDYINAGFGSDTVAGGDGHDTIIATDGQDLLGGGDGNDSINAGNGNDTILGGDGKDTILGGGGNDIILGGDGDDQINGQGGSDTVAGNQGVDTIADSPSEINESFTLSAALIADLNA